jgi:dihydroorotate dehydrogenase
MYSMLRPLLFNMDPESAHAFSLSALHYIPQFCFKKSKPKSTNALGLEFPHVVGLAAGLDKNGEHLDALAKLDFSFIELGTVTPKPQVGNSRPRLFRLPAAHAIINRMGFNNHGVDALVAHVKRARYKGILGINIGKNKDTSLEHAADDYIYCLRKVYEYASYVTINISSPNTPDLRQLQQEGYFANLLSQIKAEQIILSDKFQRHLSLVVKLSPDENTETLKQMTEVILHLGIEGIIATNTTCSRSGVTHLSHGNEMGGLSGKPLWELSTQCLRLLKQYVGADVTLIGVGGIDNCSSAQAKLDAGASLIQVYTGLIYQGPQLVYELTKGLD